MLYFNFCFTIKNLRSEKLIAVFKVASIKIVQTSFRWALGNITVIVGTIMNFGYPV